MKLRAILLLAFLTLALAVQTKLCAQQEGPNAPASSENQPYEYCTTCTGAVWDSTANTNAIDGQYSSVVLDPYLNCFQSSCYRSRYLTCYNFGFTIPPTAIITGIIVSVAGTPDANGAVRDCTIVLRRDNTNNVYGNNMAIGSPWNSNQPDHIYGGPTELWGLAWLPDDINTPDFGVYIKVRNTASQSHTVDIDAVFITVTYSIGLNVYSQTQSPKPVNVYSDAEHSQLAVSLTGSASARLRITDMTGRVCKEEIIAPGESQVDVSDLVDGMYTCTVECGGEVYTKKFVR